MQVNELKDILEPYYDNIDHIVEDLIRPVVHPKNLKYFEACQFKLKALWYINSKIEKLDNQYKQYLSLCIAEDALDRRSLRKNEKWGEDCYCYYPFYEAIEFENLLAQGKACLDCFSKAIGSVYDEKPNNIIKLINVLKEKKDNPKTDKFLNILKNADRLHGIVIDPKKNKKSIRDLITHLERADIFFTIHINNQNNKLEYNLSQGALLNMRHPKIFKMPNYLVTKITERLWFWLKNTIENSFKILVE